MNGRYRLLAGVARIWRWEFWPTWLFYLPVAPWILWLAVRYRGLNRPTAANPGIPIGGLVGQSKLMVLEQLPAAWCIPGFCVRAASADVQLQTLRHEMTTRHLEWPLVFKPDASQRGVGLKLVRNEAEAESYFAQGAQDVLVQTYHPGPHEAGIFYYRLPDAERGRIFSITTKGFPMLRGDGLRTVRELIWRDPRYRMQAATFLARHAAIADTVPDAGAELRLAVAGNHCQGTMFLDGNHLWTEALEARIEAISRGVTGFHFGRYDVRFRDLEAFRRGEDLAIVELNGIASESTDIYDPSNHLLAAYAKLYRQWRLLFQIGAGNIARGAVPATTAEIWRAIRRHYHDRVVGTVSD